MPELPYVVMEPLAWLGIGALAGSVIGAAIVAARIAREAWQARHA